MDEVEFYLKDLASRFKAIDKQKYYLSYSGGKDSHFLYWFIKEYLKDDQIEIVAVNTYMEHTAIRKRMYDNADTILLPKFKPFEIKKKVWITLLQQITRFFHFIYSKRKYGSKYIRKILWNI